MFIDAHCQLRLLRL